jgi:ubiquitin C-terminal hydrolase
MEDATCENPQCRMTNVFQKKILLHLPEILFIQRHMNQGYYSLNNSKYLQSKTTKLAPSPGFIQLKRMIKVDFQNGEEYIYELMAVIEHIGRVGSGHYVSYVKRNNGWFSMNDTNVRKITLS